eukprot:764466-Hanusia_phi.AAC.4
MPQSRMNVVRGRQLRLVGRSVHCQLGVSCHKLLRQEEEESWEFRLQPPHLRVLVEFAIPNSVVPAQENNRLPPASSHHILQEVAELYVDLSCSQQRGLMSIHHSHVCHLGHVLVAPPEVLDVAGKCPEDRPSPEAQSLRRGAEGTEVRV